MTTGYDCVNGIRLNLCGATFEILWLRDAGT
jgi:hypothetical protein